MSCLVSLCLGFFFTVVNFSCTEVKFQSLPLEKDVSIPFFFISGKLSLRTKYLSHIRCFFFFFFKLNCHFRDACEPTDPFFTPLKSQFQGKCVFILLLKIPEAGETALEYVCMYVFI